MRTCRLFTVAALAGAFLAGPAGAESVPARNLLVSWRVVSGGEASNQARGLRQGQVVIDSERGVSGRGVVELSTRQLRQDQQAYQQVMVLNGRRVRLDLRQQRPVTQWQWASQWTPGAGGGLVSGQWSTPADQQEQRTRDPRDPRVGVVAQTVWVDSGMGLAATPRWPGGRAPVTIELEAEAPVEPASLARGGSSDVPPPRLVAQTTVTAPLGQWVTVAQTQRQDDREQQGLLGTRSVQRDEQAVLEIQVSLP